VRPGAAVSVTVTPDEALARILRNVDALDAVDRPIRDALDHVLAEDVTAPIHLPSYDNSAMDGYAVRSADLTGPRELIVVGDVRAGYVAHEEVRPGTAIRIMTGAAIPRGADAVIQYEKTRACGADDDQSGPLSIMPPTSIRIESRIEPGTNIRRAGEDIRSGSLLMTRGQQVGPSEVAVLAAIGRSHVRVVPRPVIAVLSTGDELVEPGLSLGPGQIFNSNGFALGALVARAGGELLTGVAVPDSLPELRARMAELLEVADLVVTSGGASGGAYDIVGQLASREGMVESLAVRMKPGKPLAIGWLNRPPRSPTNGQGVPFIGLPGNPVAAMVAFELFARPTILRLRGIADLDAPTVTAIAEEDFSHHGDRVSYVRVSLQWTGEIFAATSVGLHRSGALSSLLSADGLAEIPGDGVGGTRGELIRVRLVDWSGGLRSHLRHAHQGSPPMREMLI